MVRVGGGWMALDEFLVKNDPCRGNFSNNFKSKINNIYGQGHKRISGFPYYQI